MVESVVRPGLASETEALAALAAETFPLACPPGTSPAAIEEFLAANLSAANFARFLAAPDHDVLVAVAPDQPDVLCGYTVLSYTEPADADVRAVVLDRPAAQISKCYVRPTSHGTGTASQLIEASVDAATARGAEVVWLGVNVENARANRFYGRHGFLVVGPKTFLLGGREEHDYVRVRRTTSN